VILFIVIAGVMVLAALAWIVVPLLRREKPTGVQHEAANLAVLRDQLSELDADLERGIITQEHYEQSRRELEARVLEDTTVAEREGTAPAFAGAWTAAIAASALPIAAVLLYALLGNYEAFLPQQTRASADAAAQHDLTPEKVAQMAAKLEERLQQEPENAEGWVVLAHTYFAMKRLPDAVRAYEQAVKRIPDNPKLLADYADAVAATQNSIEGKPLELVERALKIDPTHWKALALAGTAAFDRKDYKLAVDYWERLRAALPPNSEMLRSVEASIDEAKTAGGITTATASAAPPPGKQATITGTVNLSAALNGKATPNDTVFVFARAAQGPRMPLAILRKQVKDLPTQFSLDDSMAMTPEMKISNFDEVVVGARISKSGSAAPQAGDLEGFSKPVKIGANNVDVVIDTARP
jgi:cytochrome c-type biogenesis protein CcmH